MPIIPLPIFIPDDGSKDVIIPEPVCYLLIGGLITAVIGIICILIAGVMEIAFDKETDLLFKVASISCVTGVCVTLIGFILALITGQVVDG